MSGVLERAAGFFLAPAATQRPEAATLPPAVRAVVLGTAADATPLAAALALSLRAAAHAPAVVAVWEPGAGVETARAAASRAASRLAAHLSAHDLPATARGRLAWLALPPEPAAAVAAVRRASAIVEGPLVTALTGARPAGLEDLVAEHDVALVVAAPASPLARAAIAGLVERGVAGTACAPLGRGLPRRLALAGLAGPRLDVWRLAAATSEGHDP